MKDCEELLSGISDYVDGTASKELCAELQRHMEGCPDCRVVVDSIQKTVRLFRGEEEVDLPDGFHEKLHGTLREAWARRHGKAM
jgi:anti-sigma factor RsiW